ncbi:MAG: hypothetical protein KME13_25105 [Myxacorys californica WJT36-NPBG1]|jgi:hypothetical protein|nr:hypothetical protein [Myxacorys californica WJT36-NPBG1]
MVAIRGQGFTLRDVLEHFDERYDLSEIIERLKEITAAKQAQCVEAHHHDALKRLVELLEQATDQALEVETLGLTSYEH